MGPAARLVKRPDRDKRAILKNAGFMVPAHRWRRQSISRSAESCLQSTLRVRASRGGTTAAPIRCTPAETEGRSFPASGVRRSPRVFDLPPQALRLLYD